MDDLVPRPLYSDIPFCTMIPTATAGCPDCDAQMVMIEWSDVVMTALWSCPSCGISFLEQIVPLVPCLRGGVVLTSEFAE